MSEPARDHIERLNDYVRRMNAVECGDTYATIRPKDAATLILIDRSGPVPKVLLGKRHQRHLFMPGKFVFPGGRVDPSDKHMPSATPLDARAQERLSQRFHKASPARARALALAAVRETFEETGLLLGTRAKATRVPKGPWQAFAQHGVLPDLAAIHFIGRAITPPGRPRRFDARFFSMDANAITHRIDGVTGPDTELIELVWVPLSEAKRLDMAAVTGVMLEELDARIANNMPHDMPVPFYRMIRGSFLREVL
jgi:8-oxo-dGTP pyrophosphatase MutT (NUDIX family)